MIFCSVEAERCRSLPVFSFYFDLITSLKWALAQVLWDVLQVSIIKMFVYWQMKLSWSMKLSSFAQLRLVCWFFYFQPTVVDMYEWSADTDAHAYKHTHKVLKWWHNCAVGQQGTNAHAPHIISWLPTEMCTDIYFSWPIHTHTQHTNMHVQLHGQLLQLVCDQGVETQRPPDTQDALVSQSLSLPAVCAVISIYKKTNLSLLRGS